MSRSDQAIEAAAEEAVAFAAKKGWFPLTAEDGARLQMFVQRGADAVGSGPAEELAVWVESAEEWARVAQTQSAELARLRAALEAIAATPGPLGVDARAALDDLGESR